MPDSELFDGLSVATCRDLMNMFLSTIDEFGVLVDNELLSMVIDFKDTRFSLEQIEAMYKGLKELNLF